MGFSPRVAAGTARGSTGRGSRLAGAGPPSCRRVWGPGLAQAGREHGDLGFPGDGCLGGAGVREFRRAFCARSECRCRPGRLRVCRHARTAESAVAAIASSDEAVVTWVDVIDRIAWRRPAVKDSSSAVTGVRDLRRSARAAAALVRSAAVSLARTSWVAVSQAQASWMTSRGEPDRRTGPQDGAAGAPPGAGDRGLVLAERGLRCAPPGQIGLPDLAGGGGLVVEEGGDHGAGLRELLAQR
jgi:hypothetical protein